MEANPVNITELPHREVLAVEIKFWKNIFAKISQHQHIIHDSDNLSIIYKTVRFDSTITERSRSKKLKALKKQIKKLLLKFHSGRFELSQLSSWELNVYKQFLNINDKNKYLLASKRIRVQQGIRENFLAGVKRSSIYLPHIKKMFEEAGLPLALIYLPHIESSFNPIARSHVGAAGMWQFMRGTARRYMKINRVKDERFDPLISTKAATRLLKHNYSQLGDWALAITAYNHGLGSMRKAKRRYHNYINIRENYLKQSFGFASRNFYPEFLAVVEICDSLNCYFPNLEKNSVMVFQEIKLPKSIKLNRFAQKFNIDPEEFKRLNPGFRRSVWRGSRNVPARYLLRLPVNVDGQKILAQLGASKTERREVIIAQKSLDQNKLIITDVKKFYKRRQYIESSIAAVVPGVEVDDFTKSNIITDEMYALLASDKVTRRELAVKEKREPFFDGQKHPFSDRVKPQKPVVNLLVGSVDLLSPLTFKMENPGSILVLQERKFGEMVFQAPKPGVIAPLPITGDYSLAMFPQDLDYSLVILQERKFGEMVFQAPKPGVIGPLPITGDYSLAMFPQDLDYSLVLKSNYVRNFPSENFGQGISGKPGVEFGVLSKEAKLLLSDNVLMLEFPSHKTFNIAQIDRLNPGQLLTSLKPGVEQSRTNLALAQWTEKSDKMIAMEDTTKSKLPVYFASEHTRNNLPKAFTASFKKWRIVSGSRELSEQEVIVILKNRLNVERSGIIVFPQETLGHYSDWLNINTFVLRRLNNIFRSRSIKTGQRLELDFSQATPAEFMEKRLNYHIELINKLLKDSQGIELVDYMVKSGENLWSLAYKRYKFPVNLLLYFNDLDKLERLYPGDIIKLPVIYH